MSTNGELNDFYRASLYQAFVGQEVLANTLPEPVALRLDSVMEGRPNPGFRPPFSMLLSTPLNIALVDGLYELKLPNGAMVSFYMTCIVSSRPERRAYQIVVN